MFLALTLLASGLISGFATQASMRSFSPTLKVMNNAGASKSFITSLFIWRYFRLSLKGALIGVIAGVVLTILWAIFNGSSSGVLSGWRPKFGDIIWLAILAALFALVCTAISGLMAWLSADSSGKS